MNSFDSQLTIQEYEMPWRVFCSSWSEVVLQF